ncbi:DUF2997 domain-containing protein [bacterium]|nr:DUF2997 domain-containing protein [bacterium]
MVDNTRGIKIIANPDGLVRIEAVGFKGAACSTDVGALQSMMGLTGAEESLKPEFFEGDQNIRLNQGG